MDASQAKRSWKVLTVDHPHGPERSDRGTQGMCLGGLDCRDAQRSCSSSSAAMSTRWVRMMQGPAE
jgi:hypothetical protein